MSGDWEVAKEDLDMETSDTGEMSGAFEELENRSAIENTLEEDLFLVSRGLDSIKRRLRRLLQQRRKAHQLNPNGRKPIQPPRKNASNIAAYINSTLIYGGKSILFAGCRIKGRALLMLRS